MAGVFDKVNAALNGHTTSGLDAAMQSQADKLHPVGGSAPDTKITTSTAQFTKPMVKPPGGWGLKLPSDK